MERVSLGVLIRCDHITSGMAHNMYMHASTTLVFTSHVQTVILCGKAQLVGTVDRPRFDSYLFHGLPTPRT